MPFPPLLWYVINKWVMSNNQVQSSILNPASVIYGILDSHIKRHHCINQNLKVGWSWLKFAAVVVVLFLPAKKMACRTFKLVIKGKQWKHKVIQITISQKNPVQGESKS